MRPTTGTETIYVDFAFADASGRSVFIGWSEAQDLSELRLQTGTTAAAAAFVDRYPRRDLKTDRALGFLLVFEAAMGDDDPSDRTLRFGPAVYPVECDDSGARRLVAVGVDEAFFNMLMTAGRDAIRLPHAPELLEQVLWRLRECAGRNLDTAERCIAIDRCVLAGAGFVEGWLMTASRAAPRVTAMVVSPEGIRPFDVHVGAVRRDDLHGFADRFHFDGEHGFAGAFALPGHSRREGAVVCLHMESPGQPSWVVAPVDHARRSEMLEEFTEVLGSVGSAATRRDLLAEISAGQCAVAAMLTGPAEAAPGPGRDVVVIVELDAEPSFLRDVLIRFVGEYDGAIRLLALDPVEGEGPEAPLLGLAAELEDRLAAFDWTLVPGGTLEDHLAGAETGDDARAVFARLSTLDHAARDGSAILDGQGAEVRVFPVTGAGGLSEPIHEHDAFILACPFGLVRRAWLDAPSPFLTEEAQFRFLADTLVRSGIAAVEAGGADRLFGGTFGRNSRPVGKFASRRDYDRAVRRAMEVR